MKIAIHHRQGSYSDIWIDYCRSNKINYKIVNCFENDIMSQLQDCVALLWHHHEAYWKESQFAKSILFAIEHSGIKVFPNFQTGWHYDDKVAQKYLFEGINAPFVPTYIFYEKKEAISNIDKLSYPKVFKLKGGAGSSNVVLINNKKQAIRYVNKAFGKGFSKFNKLKHVKERFRRVKEGQESAFGLIKGIARVFLSTPSARKLGRDRNYIYFQDFLPNNTFDIRIVVIADKAIGLRRGVRKGDFRASGSGNFDYKEINKELVEIAFSTAEKLNLQSVAFDFIFKGKVPVIVEMSYAFGTKGILNAPGYWERDLSFVKGFFDPRIWMIEELIEECNFKRSI